MASNRSRSTRTPEDLDQPALPGTSMPRWRGPVERSITKRVLASCDHLTDSDQVAVALLKSSARAVDWCERNGERHTQALHVARMSELLTKLLLEPSARSDAGQGGEPDAWDLAARQLADPAGTAPGGHPQI